MRHVRVSPSLCLVEQTYLTKAVKKEEPEAINHIWIIDRSYSMCHLLDALITDLKSHLKVLKKGDTVTIGWFSSEGEYNFAVKGFKVSEAGDLETVERILDQNSSPIGTTCYSEILENSNTVVNDLRPFGSVFSFMLFTDGYPVVRNYRREIENIFSAIKKLNGVISSALFVGYGNYYNKELMLEMAEKLGGTLIHSSSLQEFSTCFSRFVKTSEVMKPKVEVNLEHFQEGDLVFTVTGDCINLYEVENKTISFSPTKNQMDSIYVLSSKPAGEEIKVSEKDLRTLGNKETLIKGIYAASYILCQKAKTDVACEILATLGEAYLIEKLTNAYTPEEYGVAEKYILKAMNDETRLFGGYKPNYLPPADAFCLLDALDILTADKEAFFYPYHDSFVYNRIGAKAVKAEDTPSFAPEKNAKVPLSSLVWNSSKLNLSIKARIEGTVVLGTGYKKYGFQKNFPTNIFRSYTVVKDGFLNLKLLPVSMSKDSFTALQKQGLIDSLETYKKGLIYDINLDAVPVINRAMAEGRTSATKLAEAAIKELQLKGQLKALKWLKDKHLEAENLSDEKVGVFASFSDEQVEFLKENCITKNGFSPKVTKAEPTDYYFAKEFTLKVKGLSSFPKVEDVKKKIEAGKKLNNADEMVKLGLDLYEKEGAQLAPKVKLAWLNDTIETLTKEARQVSREIQETKFAVLLAKKSFDEFKSRDENVLEHNGFSCTFSLREVQVAY